MLRQVGDLASTAPVAAVHIGEHGPARRAPRLNGEIFHAREGTRMSEVTRRVVHMTEPSKPTFDECIAEAYAIYVQCWFDNQEAAQAAES